MVSVEEIRTLAGDTDMSEKDAEEIRDSLRILAEIILEQWVREVKAQPPQYDELQSTTY
jgi:hypothetical protein